MKHLISASVAAFGLLGQLAYAHEFKVGDLVIDHPMAFETFKTARSGAGYLSVTNNGTEPDRLIAVEADFPRVMLHMTEMKNDIATMPNIDGIEILPGETVTMEPGGLHVMFMGLDGDPFEVGETFDATLIFERAGPLDVTFVVEARDGGAAPMDHSDHSGDISQPTRFQMTFRAIANGTILDCTKQVVGFGPDASAMIGLNDLRFYVSDVMFHTEAGASLSAAFDENEFQLVRDSGSVAMIDLTSNDAGSCVAGSLSFGEGTARTNASVTGTREAGTAKEISFRVGVPQALMQDVIASGSAEDAPSPMDEMYWNWASGYRHFVLNHTVDMEDGTYGEGYVHIGSRACGPATAAKSDGVDAADEESMGHGMVQGLALSDKDRCDFINTAEVRLPIDADDTITIDVDLGAILSDLPFISPVIDRATMVQIGRQPGVTCHSSPMQEDCPVIFDAFGIDMSDGSAHAERQVVFTVAK